jgi:hypothetical protein
VPFEGTFFAIGITRLIPTALYLSSDSSVVTEGSSPGCAKRRPSRLRHNPLGYSRFCTKPDHRSEASAVMTQVFRIPAWIRHGFGKKSR